MPGWGMISIEIGGKTKPGNGVSLSCVPFPWDLGMTSSFAYALPLLGW